LGWNRKNPIGELREYFVGYDTATRERHSSTLWCRCLPGVSRFPIDDLLDSLITSLRIVALDLSHRVQFV
jgi:hypothetical protein